MAPPLGAPPAACSQHAAPPLPNMPSPHLCHTRASRARISSRRSSGTPLRMAAHSGGGGGGGSNSASCKGVDMGGGTQGEGDSGQLLQQKSQHRQRGGEEGSPVSPGSCSRSDCGTRSMTSDRSKTVSNATSTSSCSVWGTRQHVRLSRRGARGAALRGLSQHFDSCKQQLLWRCSYRGGTAWSHHDDDGYAPMQHRILHASRPPVAHDDEAKHGAGKQLAVGPFHLVAPAGGRARRRRGGGGAGGGNARQ